MLFHVRMDVAIPHQIDPAERTRLVTAERERALALQEAGTWLHLWRIVGKYFEYQRIRRPVQRRTPRDPVDAAAVPIHDN